VAAVVGEKAGEVEPYWLPADSRLVTCGVLALTAFPLAFPTETRSPNLVVITEGCDDALDVDVDEDEDEDEDEVSLPMLER